MFFSFGQKFNLPGQGHAPLDQGVCIGVEKKVREIWGDEDDNTARRNGK